MIADNVQGEFLVLVQAGDAPSRKNWPYQSRCCIYFLFAAYCAAACNFFEVNTSSCLLPLGALIQDERVSYLSFHAKLGAKARRSYRLGSGEGAT